ncbi:unnamed protein product [Ambrosiozyma monospora]|uniref:Unnamed protein product n=1 Tax=Ambrosiozyma monospora TaxID=43982 RepID=A0A9W6YVV6_AMBMO|nr:unnamed protein product [Ambrosiozyma monospora]
MSDQQRQLLKQKHEDRRRSSSLNLGMMAETADALRRSFKSSIFHYTAHTMTSATSPFISPSQQAKRNHSSGSLNHFSFTKPSIQNNMSGNRYSLPGSPNRSRSGSKRNSFDHALTDQPPIYKPTTSVTGKLRQSPSNSELKRTAMYRTRPQSASSLSLLVQSASATTALGSSSAGTIVNRKEKNSGKVTENEKLGVPISPSSSLRVTRSQSSTLSAGSEDDIDYMKRIMIGTMDDELCDDDFENQGNVTDADTDQDPIVNSSATNDGQSISDDDDGQKSPIKDQEQLEDSPSLSHEGTTSTSTNPNKEPHKPIGPRKVIIKQPSNESLESEQTSSKTMNSVSDRYSNFSYSYSYFGDNSLYNDDLNDIVNM